MPTCLHHVQSLHIARIERARPAALRLPGELAGWSQVVAHLPPHLRRCALDERLDLCPRRDGHDGCHLARGGNGRGAQHTQRHRGAVQVHLRASHLRASGLIRSWRRCSDSHGQRRQLAHRGRAGGCRTRDYFRPFISLMRPPLRFPQVSLCSFRLSCSVLLRAWTSRSARSLRGQKL